MNDDLKTKLESWKVAPTIPSGFQREVWQRIAASRPRNWREAFSDFLMLFSTPRYAALAVTAAIVVAAGAAQLDATAQNRQDWQGLGAAYLRSVNPLELASTRSTP